MIDWNDIRFFLSVANNGTLAGAAKELGVNHSTVFRRINEFEKKLGVRLFERLPTGYVVTVAGEETRQHALKMEGEASALERKLSGKDFKLSGTIRVTTPDALGLHFLMPHLHGFYEQYPDIHTDLIISRQYYDLSRRQADVSIRVGGTPPDHLIGRKLGSIAWGVYGSKSYLAQHGRPTCDADLLDHKFIMGDSSFARHPNTQWAKQFTDQESAVFTSNNIVGLYSAAAHGFGLAVLPCYLGDIDRALEYVLDPGPALDTELWLLTHPDLRQTARIKAFADFIVESFRNESAALTGKFRTTQEQLQSEAD